MRHKYKGRKLGTSHGHTKAMKVSLVQALFLNDRIKTTETRAKEVRRDVDRIITWAKRGDLHSRRLAIAALGNDSELVREIFEKVSQGMFEGRPGGYTRIMKLGPRKGDGARMVIMELVTENCIPKAQRKAASAAGADSKGKAAPKKKAAPTKKAKKDAEEKAEADIKESEEANDADRENVIERIHDSIEAAEEEAAAEIREDGEEQLAEEKAEAQKDSGMEDLKEAAAEALEKKEAEPSKDASAEEEKTTAEIAEEKVAEKAKAEEAVAADAKAADNAPNSADMPESEEHAK